MPFERKNTQIIQPYQNAYGAKKKTIFRPKSNGKYSVNSVTYD